MTKHGTTMALAAASLAAAPLFISPIDTPKMTVRNLVAGATLQGTPTLGETGLAMKKAVSLGGVAIVVAGLGQRRHRMKISVCAADSKSEADETPPPPPPPPPFDPAKQVGAMAPLGFFDPAGFSKVGDKEGFNNLRAAEIKHGRVAMMAALGAVVQHYVKFPGFEKVPAGFGAVVTAPGTYGFIALLLVGAGLELAVWVQDPKKEPGNFGNPVGWGSYDDDMRNKEINNGRFAMFAALGIISADLLTGKDAIQQFGV